MQDLVFVAITIAFFALSLGYVHLLRPGEVRGKYAHGINHHDDGQRAHDGLPVLRAAAAGEILT